jgi:biopolymer transport protein ExbB/TolQ
MPEYLLNFLNQYWHRTIFVVAHALLLGFYIVMMLTSLWLLWRERRPMRELENLGIDLKDTPDFTKLTHSVSAMPNSALTKQLRRGLNASSVGEEFEAQAAVEHVVRAVSLMDDVIRFCINGFVVVGLMGTLYGFYEIWQKNKTTILSDSSETYLQGMATALSVSFVGLFLALVTNFLFSLFRAWRQSFIESASSLLSQIGDLVPIESKVGLLLGQLVAPLNELVEQLTRQNNETLRGLTEAVNTRTEQLNNLINEAVGGWQSLMQEFKRETLAAVADLKDASSRLADSSVKVSATMTEVSKGLERTKDIGKIINRLEKTSEDIVAKISKRLEDATNAWARKLSSSVQEHRAAIEQQSQALEKMIKGLTAKAISDFKLVTGQISEELATLKNDFASKTDQVAAHWMTKMSHGASEMTKTMEGIVKGWQEAVTNTSANIMGALASSRELMNEVTNKVKSLNSEIETLKTVVLVLTDKAGAPIQLGRAADELAKARESLEALVASVSQNQALNDLKAALEANSGALRILGERLEGLSTTADGNKEIVRVIGDIKASLSAMQTDLLSGQVAVRIRREPRPPIPGPTPKPSWIESLKNRLPWNRKKTRKAVTNPSGSRK